MRTGRRLPFENAGRPRRAHLGRILQQLILPRGARDWPPEHLSKRIDEKLKAADVLRDVQRGVEA